MVTARKPASQRYALARYWEIPSDMTVEEAQTEAEDRFAVEIWQYEQHDYRPLGKPSFTVTDGAIIASVQVRGPSGAGYNDGIPWDRLQPESEKQSA